MRRQPADVDDRHGRDRGDADEPGVFGPQVGAGGERDRDARGGLADDEPPPGEVAPERAELATGVHVGAARLGVHGGELRRGGGVAERDGGGDDEADQHAGSGGVRGRAPGAEHAGADHRAGADGHRVGQPEAPLQRAVIAAPMVSSSPRARRSAVGGLEELDDVAGRVLEQDLLAARALRRCRCGTSRRRRGAVRPRRRCRRR